jgi:hypothetical protein
MFPYGNPDMNFSSNPTGVKIMIEGEENTRTIWENVTRKLSQNNFELGISLQEPKSI